MRATTLETKNIQRVMDMLLTAVPRQGEDYDDLAALYAATLGQWNRELLHVVLLVGGFHSQNKHAVAEGVLFTLVPKQKQRAAVKKSYKPTELLSDVRAGLLGELGAAAPRVDSYRRNLQRAYLELINERLNGRPVSITWPAPMTGMVTPAIANDDTRALLRGELRALDALMACKAATAGDRITGLHLREMRDTIARILDPRFAPQTSPAAGAMIRIGAGEEEDDTCWPNLALPFLCAVQGFLGGALWTCSKYCST